MKKLFILAIAVCSSILAFAKGPRLEYYALITYRIKNQNQESVIDQYLKQAYLPALHRMGAKNIGVFKPAATDTAAFGKMIWVLMPFASLNDYEKAMAKLEQDTQLQKDGASYLNAKHNERVRTN
jgi:hypothetical protein